VLPALTFGDPSTAIEAMLNAQVAALPEIAPEGVDSAEWAAEVALVDSLVAEAIAANGELTSDELLALARLLAPFGADTLAPVLAPSLLGDPTCTQAETSALKASYHFSLAMSSALAAKLAGIFSDRLEKTLDVAFTNGMMQAKMAIAGRNTRCKVTREIRYTTTGVRGVDQPEATSASSAQAAGPDRFFKGYRMRYSLSGDFRPVSQQELSKDALLATVDAAYRKVRSLAIGNLARLPVWAQGIISTLPPSVAETAPAPVTTEAMAPAQVRIERVSPSSVSLTVGSLGDQFTLTSNNTVTNDVPFTYDLVSVADPTIRRSMSGVLRPPMSASFGASAGAVTGVRTSEWIDGFEYGKLTCGGTRDLLVTGGDKGTWQAFEWVFQENGSAVADSVSEPLGAAEFEAGAHPFFGTWYNIRRDDLGPAFVGFTVGLRVTYIDQVTDSLKTSTEFWLTCQ
jgi:hypothetical protein